MAKYAQGRYVVQNPEKYMGQHEPIFRSSWEHTFMRFADNNPAIIQWASEPFTIPYRNPFTGRNTVYVPDFMIVYLDRNGQKHAEIVEIKPSKETRLDLARSTRDRAAVALNTAKWAAANAWCRARGLTFRVIGEDQIYQNVRRSR
jgi:hypothetical protein